MKKICFICLMLSSAIGYRSVAKEPFHFSPVYNSKIEELEKKLKTAKPGTAKLDILNDLLFSNGTFIESPEDLDTAALNQMIALNTSLAVFDDQPYRDLRIALRLGRKNNFSAELAMLKTVVDGFDRQNADIPMLLLSMRWLFNETGNQEEKLTYYNSELAGYLRKGNYQNAAACYHCIAGYYSFKGDYNSAINNTLKAGELFKAFSTLWYLHEFNITGEDYRLWGNFGRGLLYMKKALKLEKDAHIDFDLYALYRNLIQLEYDAKHYPESLIYVGQLSRLPFMSDSTLFYEFRALNYTGLNRLADARRELQKIQNRPGAPELQKVGSSDYIGDFTFYKYYLATGDLERAENSLYACYRYAAKYRDLEHQMQFMRELSELYGLQHNTAKAWSYSSLYNRMQDSLGQSTSAFHIASYENDQKEYVQNKKLADLQQQRAVQEAVIDQRTTIIWVAFVGLLAVLLLLIFIYRQLRVNRQILSNLRTTQTQLIQSEKMASLGELTAGIAHEIQNPLNFVNNFSDVNREMLAELKQELDKGDIEEAKAIATDIEQNEVKINHHGKRAEGIVKGMLEHSRTSTGQKEPLDINKLADEYLRLAYHGLRAKDKSFNAELVTHFDASLPPGQVIPQDIGRVLLNLFNNAFYAVNQKTRTAGPDYKPEVSVTTALKNRQIVISIKDNGIGIPEAIRDKILQPFFTTKPTGEGTGLGLSLSYDIIVKGHGGKIEIDTIENQYSTFTIMIPLK